MLNRTWKEKELVGWNFYIYKFITLFIVFLVKIEMFGGKFVK